MPAAVANLQGLPPGPELSTGLTPQVGTLDLPPGIEAIVPTNQPLTGAWMRDDSGSLLGSYLAVVASMLADVHIHIWCVL